MSEAVLEGHVIVIDALAARFGGTAYAALEVANALSRRQDVARIVVVTRPDSIVERGARTLPRGRIVVVARSPRAELIQRLAWEAARLPELVRRHRATGLFSLSGMLPLSLPIPFVCLQANPTPYEDPGSLRQAARRWALARTSRAARATYVPSRHVQGLVGSLPRLRVVPFGVNRDLFKPSQASGDELLCVADFYAHKHHELLVRAYSALPGPRPILRLVGNPGVDTRTFSRVKRAAADVDGVVIEGKVSIDALLAAYRSARAMVIASDRESFSMPVAEALSCGVPAVARDYPTLRETAGPGALYVQGNNPAAWTHALSRIISEDTLHARLRIAGLEHSHRYSWDDFAARLSQDLTVVQR